ncbi:MAG: Holliday junction resolvase RuvX [Candidatus Moraniibacteriota bacterium]|nr:MAG: Holliday junction resolvase RuvX [Candidatus Moranbacteria bacterium]
MENFSSLGIDWGSKKIGLAIADSETRVALPLSTIPNDEHLLDRLASYVNEYTVREVVIGIPAFVHHERARFGGELLGKQIEDAFHIPVRYENEMFTTKLARAELLARGVRRSLDDLDDQEAARIILESFLARMIKM